MSDIEDMRYFVEVASLGGFSRAAARLGVSKSVVSRSVSRLEADLGIRLLSRTTRGINPTEAGSEYKARCERILADIADARESITRRSGEVVGRLRVTAPLSFGTLHVAPVVAGMAERHPRLEVDLSLSDRFVDLIGEGFDAAVRIGTLKDSSLLARRIAPVRALLVASPAYLDRTGRPSDPAELAGHACLIYSGDMSGTWELRSGGRPAPFRPAGRMRADSGDAIAEWAVAGLGIANLPSFLIANQIRCGSLEVVLPECSFPEYGAYVLRPPSLGVPAKVRLLIDSLVARFDGQSALTSDGPAVGGRPAPA